jgi:tetratricopeptide (TPR) repeat protein
MIKLVTATLFVSNGWFCLGCGAAIEEAQEGRQRTPEELYELGQIFAVRGDLMRAEQYFLSAEEAGYPEERVLPALIRVFVRGSRFRDALAHAEPALARRPDDVRLRTLVASLRIALDDHEGALRELEHVVAAAPDQPFAHYLLAVLHRDRIDDPTRAQQHFERYLELDPAGPHADEARAFARSRQTPATGPALLESAPGESAPTEPEASP